MSEQIWQQIEKTLIKEGKVKIHDFKGLAQSVWMSVSDSTLEDQFYNELTATQQQCWLQYMVWTQSDQPPHHSDEDFPGDVQLIKKLLMQKLLAGIGRKHTPPPEDTSPPGPSRNRKSPRTRRSPSASSSQNNAVDEVAEGFAGLQISNDFPPLGSQPGSYIGAARKGAELPAPEDATKAHWKIVDENIRASQRRMGAFQFAKLQDKQAAIAKRVPNPMERQNRMDANLLLVDPRPQGHSTYMVKLGNSPAIKEALLGRKKSLYLAEKSLGVQITWEHQGQSLYVFPGARRGDPLLLDQPDVVKRNLEFAYGAVKFWRWRLGRCEKAADKPEFKECCDLWFDTDSVIVADYFEEHEKADDRFGATLEKDSPPSPDEESPGAQKPKNDASGGVMQILPDGTCVITKVPEKTPEEKRLADKVWGEQQSLPKPKSRKALAKGNSATGEATEPSKEATKTSEEATKTSEDATKAPGDETGAQSASSTKDDDPNFKPFETIFWGLNIVKVLGLNVPSFGDVTEVGKVELTPPRGACRGLCIVSSMQIAKVYCKLSLHNDQSRNCRCANPSNSKKSPWPSLLPATNSATTRNTTKSTVSACSLMTIRTFA
ncbi:hypothetical protein BGZ57DRAFT_998628 [Hyaloscypha finlandica]|nr:hypothetical protein BGZ57DRAFT_998628 [Hyaloscypha finlandica]